MHTHTRTILIVYLHNIKTDTCCRINLPENFLETISERHEDQQNGNDPQALQADINDQQHQMRSFNFVNIWFIKEVRMYLLVLLLVW